VLAAVAPGGRPLKLADLDKRDLAALTEAGNRLARAIERNPEGWTTWLALQADIAAERAHRVPVHTGRLR
jgi:Mn-dependent DtxR family transcriptional regulator